MTIIIPLQDLTQADIATAGGKGANLGELAAAGFPVPRGFVLTTAAHDAFLRDNELHDLIGDLAAAVTAANPESAGAASLQITQLILEAAISDEIKEALLAACSALGASPVAVRSSATAEDLPHASFAGQQDSFLNVSSPAALLDAVKASWASLWSARALAYRSRMGIGSEALSMAVIIQQMAPAEVSGILFTADPTTGDRGELLINASYGLGEAIVSGQVTPDTMRLDRQTMAVKEITPGSKEIMILPAAEGGTTTRPVAPAQRAQAALTAEQGEALAALALQVESHFGGVPQDIEWAAAGSEISLLQSRPITNLPPAPLQDVRWEPLRPDSVWMRRQVVEHMPEPLSPLFDQLYLQEGLDQSMQAFADFMSELSGIEINIWEIIEPPFTTTYNGYAYSLASFEISPKLIPYVLRIYIVVLPKMIRHLFPRWRDKSLPAYQAAVAAWKARDLEESSDEELLRGIRELAYQDAVYWFAAAVPLGMARITDSALDAYLRKVAARRLQEDGTPPTSGAYLWGFPSKAVDAQAQMEDIAAQIRDSAALSEAVAAAPADQLQQILAAYPEGQAVLAALQAYLETYGHQVYNLDFAVPTLADDPLPVLLSLKTAVQHPEWNARARQAQLAQQRDALTARTYQSLAPLQRLVFGKLLGWAQRYAPIREEALFYVGAAWPTLRRLALELGQRLAAASPSNSANGLPPPAPSKQPETSSFCAPKN